MSKFLFLQKKILKRDVIIRNLLVHQRETGNLTHFSSLIPCTWVGYYKITIHDSGSIYGIAVPRKICSPIHRLLEKRRHNTRCYVCNTRCYVCNMRCYVIVISVTYVVTINVFNLAKL